jgi:hypothetical protein
MSTRVPFSERPGRHERHYRRRLANDLFANPVRGVSDAELLEVQRLDHEELIGFLGELRETVQRAVSLAPNEETQVVLDLKSDLERLYETSAGLADEQAGNQTAIRQLVAVIAQTVRRSAAGDPLAMAELEQEEGARAAHFTLLEQPLVADLLHPQSAIAADELVPTLLSEGEAALTAALELFDGAQLAELVAQARALLAARDPRRQRFPDAWQRLRQMETRLGTEPPLRALHS